MNRSDLIEVVSSECNVNKVTAATMIDTVIEHITLALRKGDRVALTGFGTFTVAQRKARNGRNPQTGEAIQIAARKVAKFSPGFELKQAIQKSKGASV